MVSSTSDDAIVTGRAHAGASELSTVSGRSMEAAVSAADGTELSAVGVAEVAADEAIVSGEVAAVADELMVIGVAIEPDVGDDANELEELRLITCDRYRCRSGP
jgi:hypothetical protein